MPESEPAREPTTRLHAYVRGRVQGVNFRASTSREARRLGLTGWVRNRPDGSVEVTAEGSRASLDALVTFLQRGPSSAIVEDLHVDWEKASGEYATFSIRYS